MGKLKHICIIAEHYPTPQDPMFPFVQQLSYSLSNEGVKCSVIAPQSITRAIIRRKAMMKAYNIDVSPDGKETYIYRPYYITFSDKSVFLSRIANFLMRRAIKRSFKKIQNVDCVYCYFWHIGLTAARVLKDSTLPLFVQASECELTIRDYMQKEKYLDSIKGVVCASGKNKTESILAGLVKEEDTRVIVNGYRTDEFYSVDKTDARQKLGFDENSFIVGFVGGLIERKGVTQLCEALNRFDDAYSFFIGQGGIKPFCKNILFTGLVPHYSIADYLNAADIFVLPTRAEGCCNAIIEALACGLPVISSNKRFNDEIIDESCSIRIDESSTDEIYNAIKKLKRDSELLDKMSQSALIKAQTLTIEKRAKSIKDFIQDRI